MVIDVKEAITNAPIEILGRLVDASNATLYGVLEQTEINVIYKPISGERPLWDFEEGSLAGREVAAYLTSEFMNFNLVPFTTLREGPFGSGMVQHWVDVDESFEIIEFSQSNDDRLRKMALFDAIINNTDRKIGHLLPTKAGEIFGCDHGVTFHVEDKLRTVLWQWRGKSFSQSEIAQLENFISEFSSWSDLIENLLTEEEKEITKQRVLALLDSGKFPFPSEDWPAIPWPPV
jgi:uncharacterized repeat protein (TIGR03843 family)